MPKSPQRVSPSKGSKKNKKRIAIGLAMLMGITVVAYYVFGNQQTRISDDISANISIHEITPSVMGTATESTESAELSSGIELHPVIMDLNTLGGNPTITGLSTTLDKILVLDAANKKLYSINPQTKEAKSIFVDFEETSLPQFLECDMNFCYVGDNNKFYVLKPETPEKVDDYLPNVEGVVDLYPYGPANSVYLLTNNKIYTYIIGPSNTATTEAKEWLAPDQTFSGGKAMLIDNGVIYVLTNNEIIKFSNKRRVTTFTPDVSKISNAMAMEVAGGKLYVLDVTDSQKALQVFDKSTGEYLQTIELAEDSTNPKLFTFPKYAKGKILFEKNRILHEVTL